MWPTATVTIMEAMFKSASKLNQRLCWTRSQAVTTGIFDVTACSSVSTSS
jgi:hypothetical protein